MKLISCYHITHGNANGGLECYTEQDAFKYFNKATAPATLTFDTYKPNDDPWRSGHIKVDSKILASK